MRLAGATGEQGVAADLAPFDADPGVVADPEAIQEDAARPGEGISAALDLDHRLDIRLPHRPDAADCAGWHRAHDPVRAAPSASRALARFKSAQARAFSRGERNR